MKLAILAAFALLSTISQAASADQTTLIVDALLSDDIKAEVEMFKKVTRGVENVSIEAGKDTDFITIVAKSGSESGQEFYVGCETLKLTISRSMKRSDLGINQVVHQASLVNPCK